jgi:hypothetical protein
VHVGGDPHDVANLAVLDEPEQVGGLHLSPERQTVALGHRLRTPTLDGVR